MITDIAYKLVSQNYTSLNVGGKYELEYPFGEIVKAPEGTLGIMVFRSMKELLWFAPAGGYESHILKVIITGMIQLDNPDICLIMTDEGLDAFYNGDSNILKCYTATAPKGTVCCDEIRVLGEISIEEVGNYAQV